MAQRRRIHERRAPTRPANGDVGVCPKCGGTSLEFSERYRLAARDGHVASTPAWVCDAAGCGFIGFAREQKDVAGVSSKLRMASMNIRAESSRRVMKARFVRQRANKAFEKSLSRKKAQ